MFKCVVQFELCTFKFYNRFRISLIINEMSIIALKVVEVRMMKVVLKQNQ